MSERHPVGVLLLAYGTPDTLDDVAAYLRHIRHGKIPSTAAVTDLRARYEVIGGSTPLLRITRETARALQSALDGEARGGFRVYFAMKHWHPFIADVVRQIAADGIEHVIAIVLAPHYSRMSVGSYRSYVDEALAELREPLAIQFVDQWHLHPAFIAMMAERVRSSLAAFAPSSGGVTHVLFSAHSLPERIRTWGDPYEAQLLESCTAVAQQAGLMHWSFAWQSASDTGETWLGPDVLERMEQLQRDGVQQVLSVPIGFVCDHLEVLYDIDHEAAARAAALGLTLRRTPMPNATPEFIAVLAALVHEAGATAAVPR